MPNRLATATATSPYLLQHAENPADWRDWDEEAFAEARARDVPVLVSVGYAACHWCHVKAHESFEDAGPAAQMNGGFVWLLAARPSAHPALGGYRKNRSPAARRA